MNNFISPRNNSFSQLPPLLKTKDELMKIFFDAVEQNLVTIVLTDNQGNIEYVNQKFTEITGYSFPEVIGKNLRILKSGKTSQKEYKKLWDTITAGEEWQGELLNKKKNGDLFWEYASISAIKNANGNVTNFLGIKTDITKRKEMEKEIKNSYDQMRNLSAYLQDIRETEKTYIARRIHDELGQILSLLQLELSKVENGLPKSCKGLIAETHSMAEKLEFAVHTVQNITKQLRPSILDNLGLLSAIEWQAREFEKHTGTKCQLFLLADEPDIDKTTATVLFRILQEALTNIIRHAKANKVTVTFKRQAHALSLTVKDNGRGITKSQLINPDSLGLLGMSERAHSVNGDIKITGARNKGTFIKIIIPV